MLHSTPLAAELRTNTNNPLHQHLAARPPLAIVMSYGVSDHRTYETRFIWTAQDALGLRADAVFWLREPTPEQRQNVELSLLK